MQIINFPSLSPTCFWIVAFFWSAFQAYTGFQYGLYICDAACKDPRPKPHVRFLAYGLHHGAFYGLCSLSGFAAWRLVPLVSEKIVNWSDVAGGTGAILIALTVFTVAGISGALPRILFLGNKPV